MFTMVGVLPSGKQASLVWHDGYVFTGDRDAVASATDVIGVGAPVFATEEGPVFTPGYGDIETALATAQAAFERVLSVEADEPLPEYDGGVVDHGDVQEAVYLPSEHPRGRGGRWINVFRASSRQDYEPDPLAPSGSTKAMVEGALASILKVHDPPDVQPAERIPIIVRKQEEEATYAMRAMGNSGYARPNYIRVNPDASKFAFAHEMGHYFDHIIFGRKNPPATLPGEEFGSARAAGDPPDLGRHELVPVMKLLSESPSLLQVQRSMTDDTVQVMDLGDEGIVERRPSDFFLYGRYLTQPWEAFARAYSQWVALRSGDQQMLAEVKKHAPSSGNPFPAQWGEEEFKPIAAEFDRLFREHGLAKVGA
jgi:hypothetical protein